MSPGSSVPQVRIIRQGHLVRERGEVVEASSTVTVVDTTEGRFIVDTGSPDELHLLKSGLSDAGMSPESIGCVVNTHLHMDHCGGNDLFTRAKVLAHEFEEPPVGVVRATKDMTLAEGVRFVVTPGHTAGSMSVFVQADRRYAICGDAIPTKANYTSMLPPAINIDRKLALMSMDRILSWADIVIPGHDAPFEVLRKK